MGGLPTEREWLLSLPRIVLLIGMSAFGYPGVVPGMLCGLQSHHMPGMFLVEAMPSTCILSTAAYCMFSSKFTILGKPIQTCVKSAPEIESRVHDSDDSVSTAAPAKNAGAAAGRAV